MRRIVGNYVYTLLEEVIGRIILQSGLRTSGRSGYATIWNENSTQLKLVGHILNDIRNLWHLKKVAKYNMHSFLM